VSVRVPFSNIDSDPRDRVTDPLLKMEMAEEQFRWLIRKGDLILSNEVKEASGPFERIFTATGPKTGSISIYAYDDDDLPDRYFNARNGSFNHTFQLSLRLLMLTHSRGEEDRRS
jgi:hypothetical protein